MPELDRLPVKDWTDDEWLAVMARFPPDTDYGRAEEWLAERRRKAHAEAEEHRREGGK
jgi:monoamine oxidase